MLDFIKISALSYILCTLSYKGNGDDNFENILIDEEHKTVTSEYKNFGYAIISLISVNVKKRKR